MKPSVYILYHFFYPDDVVSAEHMRGLAEGLVKRGWEVTVLTSNRYCRDQEKRIELLDEQWNGMRIIRAPRPQYNQSSHIGRLRNSLSMQKSWLDRLKSMPQPDAIILGTDPQFSQLLFPFLRKMMPRVKLVLWGFDLYPEILEGAGSPLIALGAKLIHPLMKRAYKPADLLADIGPCMQKRLSCYAPKAVRRTLVPWALVELDELSTPEEHTRRELFGDAVLGVLYSGTIGQAHVFEKFIELARRLRLDGTSVAFCFAGRGNLYASVQAMVSPEDTNVRFADFCSIDELERRLNAADLHMISLRQGWDGAVVPSKFFGALAAGKPVLYDGSPNSDIGIWIKQFDLGILLENDSMDQAVQRLKQFVADKNGLESWKKQVLKIYRQEFSRELVLDKWNDTLKSLL